MNPNSTEKPNLLQKISVTISIISLLGMGLLYYQNTRLNGRLLRFETLYSNDSLENDNLPSGFKHVYERFSLYNKEIDTNTVVNFIEVANHFGIKSNKDVFELAIGQIIFESGARQFYGKDHKNFGKVVRGTSGEVGIAQIMPSTAVYYLSKQVKNMNELRELGASDFKFIHNKSLTDNDKEKLVITWLSDERNNLILWGFIMRDNLQKNGVLKALVAYNAGDGGMLKYDECNDIATHRYIKGIKDTLKYIEEAINV